LAVWNRLTGTDSVIEAASRPRGGMWSRPVAVSAASGQSYGPQVSVNAKGQAVAVWLRSAGAFIVETAWRSAGGTWSTPTSLSAANSSSGAPQVGLGARSAVAVWELFTDTGSVVEAAARPRCATWLGPTSLSATDGVSQDPHVAVDTKGDAVAVWSRSTFSGGLIEVARRPQRGTWSTPTALSAADGDSASPQVAVAARGGAVIVWQRSVGGGSVVEAAVTR